MRIVAISDTHAQHRDVTLPEGDVLVFAGDFMTCGRKFAEVQSFAEWFMSNPHPYKVLVAGNHDRLMENRAELCLNEFLTRDSNPPGKVFAYLKDSGCEINGIKFWGSPVQPWFCDWAFNVHRGAPIRAVWDKIPNDTDVLITHGPPYGHGDQSWPEPVEYTYEGCRSRIIRPASEHLGCEELIKAVERVKPKVHIFGHIHGGYRTSGLTEQECERLMLPYNGIPTKFYNVAICDEQYSPVNPPTVIDLER